MNLARFHSTSEGGGVMRQQGAAGAILLFHIISARPSKQPLLVRTFLKVYGARLLFFVSARTNTRHRRRQQTFERSTRFADSVFW
jgi:hypothetical protein